MDQKADQSKRYEKLLNNENRSGEDTQLEECDRWCIRLMEWCPINNKCSMKTPNKIWRDGTAFANTMWYRLVQEKSP